MKHARRDYDLIQAPTDHIPADEPVFLIRGQDKIGWMAVEAWANLAEAIGAHSNIVTAARIHAGRMQRWADDHGKTPDI